MVELGEKLLNNITSALTSDPLIDEYDFLPVEDPKANTNPIFCLDHKLGIEAWAVKVVFSYCYERLLSRGENKLSIRTHQTEITNALEWSQIVLLVVADCMTAWNIRRNLIQGGHLSVQKELKFTQLVLSKHPKSSEAFCHRKWLLSTMMAPSNNSISKKLVVTLPANMTGNDVRNDVEHVPCTVTNVCNVRKNCVSSCDNPGSLATDSRVIPSEILALLEEELIVCQCAAERYANNYHAWTHRIWVLQQHCDVKLGTRELEATERFINQHISDHSAYHYRQMIVLYVGYLNNTRSQLLTSELTMCTDLIRRYPGHEALWSHRRAIIQRMCHVSSVREDGSAAKVRRSDTSCAQSILQCEQSYCQDMLDEYNTLTTLSSDLQWQVTLLNRHTAVISRLLNDTDFMIT